MMDLAGRKGSSAARRSGPPEMAEKRASGKTKSPRVFGYLSKQAQRELRVGLYVRVSTQDQQTIPMQTRALREYATRRGWTIYLQVREVNSEAARREAREKLIEAARFAGLDP
jgi:Resolvase, N terminal domain